MPWALIVNGVVTQINQTFAKVAAQFVAAVKLAVAQGTALPEPDATIS
jgi:hypothetical protein